MKEERKTYVADVDRLYCFIVLLVRGKVRGWGWCFLFFWLSEVRYIS